jgi:hypothetical protein
MIGILQWLFQFGQGEQKTQMHDQLAPHSLQLLLV